MKKFADYEASHITPQLTLLGKFNEVLKYLRAFSGYRMFLHTLTIKKQGTEQTYTIKVFSTSDELMTRHASSNLMGNDLYISQSPLYDIMVSNAGFWYFYIRQVSYTSPIGSNVINVYVNLYDILVDEVEEL